MHSATIMGFNPRPRMEGDPALGTQRWVIISFNPRPRMEGDLVAAGRD